MALPPKEVSPSLVPKERWEKLRKDLPKLLAEIGPTVPNQLAHLPKTAPPELVMAHLARDGAVIIDEVVSGETCDQLVAEMRPYMEEQAKAKAEGHHEGGSANYSDFLGHNTVRVGALPVRSKASWDVITQPVLMDAAAGVLAQQLLYEKPSGRFAMGFKEHPWQLHVSQIVAIGPNEPPQSLHRDRWTFGPDMIFAAGLEPELHSIWALSDFTVENGATRVIPGSHKWAQAEIKYAALEKTVADQAAVAEMKKGSCVIYTGSVLHSAGRNVSKDQTRIGMVIAYNLAWLRQEENQYLACPPEAAKDLPRMIQKLIGYERRGYSLGYYDNVKDPEEAFEETRPRNWASTAWKPDDAKAWKQPETASKL